MHRSWKKVIFAGVGMAGMYFGLNAMAKACTEDEKIDDDNPYMDCSELKAQGSRNIYVNKVKPALDKALAFGGLLALSPVFAAVSIAVYVDAPGPIFFTQKRVGKDGRFFLLHKYRSMKMSAPHDVPTHQLVDPEHYITRVGKILRKTSLDELPQIWDIFRGKMSVVGPRPALWNQEDLVAERDKYGANSMMPGLTGLAQIKGRDELEIPEKARVDGEYVRKLKQGGWKALFFDAKCLVGTFFSVVRRDGVVEGGTGKCGKEGRD